MKVTRIVANLHASNPALADRFYRDILGLHVAMDHGWIRTYAGDDTMAVQLSIASEGGSGTAVPDLSSKWMTWTKRCAGCSRPASRWHTARPMNPGACGGSTSAIRWGGWSTSFSTCERASPAIAPRARRPGQSAGWAGVPLLILASALVLVGSIFNAAS